MELMNYLLFGRFFWLICMLSVFCDDLVEFYVFSVLNGNSIERFFCYREWVVKYL